MIHACFSSFIRHCHRLELPEPWCDCTGIRNGFRGPGNPGVAFEQIAQVHSAEELLAAGLAERGSDGRIAIHRFLAEPGVIGLGITEAARARSIRLSPIAALCPVSSCRCWQRSMTRQPSVCSRRRTAH